MNEARDQEQNQDPAPIEHVDAERVSSDENEQVPAGADAPRQRDEPAGQSPD